MIVLRLISLILIFVNLVTAQGLNDWKTITYINDITDLFFSDDQIWASTTGGVYRFDTADSLSVLYTHLEWGFHPQALPRDSDLHQTNGLARVIVLPFAGLGNSAPPTRQR